MNSLVFMCGTDENKSCEEEEQCQIIYKAANNTTSSVCMPLSLTVLPFWKTGIRNLIIQRCLTAPDAGFSDLLSPSYEVWRDSLSVFWLARPNSKGRLPAEAQCSGILPVPVKYVLSPGDRQSQHSPNLYQLNSSQNLLNNVSQL